MSNPDDFPWVQDGLTDIEEEAVRYLQEIQRRHPSMAEDVLAALWLANGINESEEFFLCTLANVRETTTAQAILVNMVRRGATDLTPAVRDFLPPCPIPTPTPVSSPDDFPWVQDGLTDIEEEAVGYLQEIQRRHPSMAGDVLSALWLANGINESEEFFLCTLASVRETATAQAILVAMVRQGETDLTPSVRDFLPPCPTPAPTPVSSPVNFSSYTAVINTNQGAITVELYAEEAPQTVDNFITLAEKGFYEGVIFHRVIPEFMIQGGDPTGTGGGGPGYQFDDEISPNLSFDSPGILAMANAGRNTNGSQFFITVAPTPHLTGGHTIFGKVTDGQDVADAISKAPTAGADRPLSDVIINTIEIIRDAG